MDALGVIGIHCFLNLRDFLQSKWHHIFTHSEDESRLLGRRMHATGCCKGSANGAAQQHRQWSVHEHAYEFGLLAAQQVDQIHEYAHGHPNSTPKARIRAMKMKKARTWAGSKRRQKRP